MKFRLLVMSVFAFGMMSCMTAISQDNMDLDNPIEVGKTHVNILLGPVVGFNRSMHTTDLSTFNNQLVPCPTFKEANNSGFFVGAFYEQLLGGKQSKHSIVARLLYNTMPASFSVDGDNLPSLVEGTGGEMVTVNTTTKHENEVKYSMFTVEAMYKFRAIDIPLGGLNAGLVLTAGPSVDIPMTKTQDQSYKLISPNNVQFKYFEGTNYSPDRRTIYVNKGDIPNAASTRFAMKFGAQLEIITGGAIDFIPGVFYNWSLTDVSSDQDWKVNAIQIGLDIRFSITI